MNLFRALFLLIVIVFLGLFIQPAKGAEEPVVHVVLFFSPYCGHCHKVMTEDLPPLKEQYGKQLQILEVDTTQSEGQALFQSLLEKAQTPKERTGVPTLIIGGAYLVGSNEIPEKLPGLIASGLNNGGIDWPNIPGLNDFLILQGVQEEITLPNSGMWGNFQKDPLANTIAVTVLIMMIISLISVVIISLSDKPTPEWLASWPDWIIPVLSLIGMGVAGYLTYVETSHTSALCGPIGDCNAVQTSPYAKLFGVIPIGILGIFGYLTVLACWGLKRFGPQTAAAFLSIALWAMCIFGILFSIYLTFLEPFVIGATCAWCITSAVVMTLLLWLTTPSAHDALNEEN